jgi:hypothetical protein
VTVRIAQGGKRRILRSKDAAIEEALDQAGRQGLVNDLLTLIGRMNRADDGTMVVPSEYLEAAMVKK